jgi:hypothetical protein
MLVCSLLPCLICCCCLTVYFARVVEDKTPPTEVVESKDAEKDKEIAKDFAHAELSLDSVDSEATSSGINWVS